VQRIVSRHSAGSPSTSGRYGSSLRDKGYQSTPRLVSQKRREACTQTPDPGEERYRTNGIYHQTPVQEEAVVVDFVRRRRTQEQGAQGAPGAGRTAAAREATQDSEGAHTGNPATRQVRSVEDW